MNSDENNPTLVKAV